MKYIKADDSAEGCSGKAVAAKLVKILMVTQAWSQPRLCVPPASWNADILSASRVSYHLSGCEW